jgi:tetratricopeptide (TPR) repeat protein
MSLEVGQQVAVHYQIFCFDEKNEEIQIENTKEVNPLIFEISKSTLAIEFFSEHVITMSANDSKTITTTVQKLYGLFGHPLLGLHPAAPLKVELTLLEILPREPHVPDTTLYARALKCKEEGNIFVSQQKYDEAKKCYLSGISLYIEDLRSDSQTRSAETELLLVQSLNNMAQCDLKLKNYNSVMDTCAYVFDLTSKDESALAKAHFRFGMALEELRNEHLKNKLSKADKDWLTKESRFHYQQSDKYAKGTDPNVKKKLLNLNKIINAPKGLFVGMFASEGDSHRGLTKF